MRSQKQRLDQFTLDIEFLLISVIQGVALATLGTQAASILGNFQMEYLLYVVAGFLFILVFWSSAIIHALSFIDWPLNLAHTFLYFLAGLIEVVAFSHMTDPLKWFAFTSVFFFTAEILYIVDYFLIKKHEKALSLQNKKLYEHVFSQQKLEMYFYVPAGLLFNGVAWYFINVNRDLFLTTHAHLWFVGLQVVFAIFFLTNSLFSFKKRAKLISESTLSD